MRPIVLKLDHINYANQENILRLTRYQAKKNKPTTQVEKITILWTG